MKRLRMLSLVIAAVVAGYVWANTRPAPLPADAKADLLVVEKGQRGKLLAYSHGLLLRSYSVSLGRQTGPKLRQGDRRTPEGQYMVDSHNPNSSFHRALHVSYPSKADVARSVLPDTIRAVRSWFTGFTTVWVGSAERTASLIGPPVASRWPI